MNNYGYTTPVNDTPKKKGQTALIIILITIIIIAVLVITGCLYYLFLREKTDENYSSAVHTYMDAIADYDYDKLTTVVPSYLWDSLDGTTMSHAGMDMEAYLQYLKEYAPYSLSYEITSSGKLDKESLLAYEKDMNEKYSFYYSIANAYKVSLNCELSLADGSDSTNFELNLTPVLYDGKWYIYETDEAFYLKAEEMAKLYEKPFFSYFNGILGNIDLMYNAYADFDDEVLSYNLKNYYNNDPEEYFDSLHFGYDVRIDLEVTGVDTMPAVDIDSFVTEIFDFYGVEVAPTEGKYIDFEYTFHVQDGNDDLTKDGTGTAFILRLDGIWYFYDGSWDSFEIFDLVTPEAGDEYVTLIDNYFTGIKTQNVDLCFSTMTEFLIEDARDYLDTYYFGEGPTFFYELFSDFAVYLTYNVTNVTRLSYDEYYDDEWDIWYNYERDVHISGGYAVDIAVDLGVYTENEPYYNSHTGTIMVHCVDGQWIITDLGYYNIFM